MNRRISLAMLSAVMLVVSSSLLEAQEERTHISAVAVVVRGMAATSSTYLDINIKEFTSDAKRDELLGVLQSKGPDALRRAMEKLDVGQISPTGRVGIPIAFARKYPTGDGGTMYTIVTARNMGFMELRGGGRTTDYPFNFVQIVVDADGKGHGQVILAAKINFDEKEGRVAVESYGLPDTIRLEKARVKKK
jgi:hypothetical protein